MTIDYSRPGDGSSADEILAAWRPAIAKTGDEPWRGTTRCAYCDYMTVLERDDDETIEAFADRAAEQARRLQAHCVRAHPDTFRE